LLLFASTSWYQQHWNTIKTLKDPKHLQEGRRLRFICIAIIIITIAH